MSQVLSEEEIINIAKSALKAELQVASIYNKLSNKYSGDIANKLMHFENAEKGHANFWREFLLKRGVDPSTIEINQFKVSILAFFFGLLGVGLTLKILEASERNIIHHYSRIHNSQYLTDQEKESIAIFLLAELAHEEELLEYESRYRFFIDKIGTIFTQTSGGLVIVISTAIGLAGVYDNSIMIGITGLIVGLTGAMNTVVGFYFFGRTGRRIKEDILYRIKMTCECAPHAYLRRIEKYMKGKD